MFISDQSSLDLNPVLKNLLSTDSPDALFLTARLEKRYNVTLSDGDRYFLSLLTICSLYGKTAHLTALWPSNASTLDAFWYESAIQYAAYNGHTATIRYLESYLTADERIEAVKAGGYKSITNAARNGHTATIQHLLSHLTPYKRTEAVKTNQCYAIRLAAYHGHIVTIQHLEGHVTVEEFIETIKALGYEAIRYTSYNGHTATIQYLENYLTADEWSEALKLWDYESIRLAAQNGHTGTLHHLLQTDIALAYMESHDREYGIEYIYPYVNQRLVTLRTAKADFEHAYPQGVFDVSQKEARQGFYLLRNLIRRGVARDDLLAQDHSESMRFLLSIPGIRALCAQCLNPEIGGYDNELLRFALRLGNQTAAGMLMHIPQVRRMAALNRHYRHETLGDIDLAAQARNTESSMVALNPPERQALATVEQHYQQTINTRGGTDAVFAELVSALKSRYIEHPASFKRRCPDGAIRKRRLPLTWADFQALITEKHLSPKELQLALEAYYQHPVHTAFRYLSKPNHWMAANAGYVNRYVDDDGFSTDFHYSTFEDYRPLISLLYTAAFDEQTPAIEGYTLAGRRELFIQELALIGRAHNWDGYRINTNTNKTEQYDDLQGDKPSCYSGVTRRLFQSVLGHPLLKQLNPNLVKQCVNEHVRNWFKSQITLENVRALHAANQVVIAYEDNCDSAIQTLATLNITPQGQEHILTSASAQLASEFPQPFAANALAWRECMKEHLINTTETAKAHFIAFDGIAKLSALVEDALLKVPSSVSEHGIFATTTPSPPLSAKVNLENFKLDCI